MIDERFSIREFEARGRNSEAANELSGTLQAVIAELALPELRELARRIADRLRDLGHPLVEASYEVDPAGMASVTFADRSQGPERELHRLRFNLDLVVSAGFGDGDPDDSEDEVSGLLCFDPGAMPGNSP